MSYIDQWSLESKLNNKADKFNVLVLEGKIDHLLSENSKIKFELSELQAISNNRKQMLCLLIDVLIESKSIAETNQLNEIKNYI